MKISRLNAICFGFLCLLLLQAGVLHAFTLPAFFSDGMVLQQQDTVKIWGWGSSREPIQVYANWETDTLRTVVNSNGDWALHIPTPKAGGPHEIFIKGHNTRLLRDILIGEVWICSGQSNMEWTANAGIDNAAAEIEAAAYPNIRFFTVDHRSAEYPQLDLSGSWAACSPETMRNFSAVGYFFGRKLHIEMGVPIGIINSSWGGTPAEIWTPASRIEADETLAQAATKIGPRPWGPYEPGRAFHTMIAPLTGFRIAGAIWYQGESNVPNAATYQHLFSTMINSWRDAWGYEFPFYWAQIAPFTYGAETGVRIRDEQRKTLSLPQTGMVVTSDIGDTTDIHPKNKQSVGLRLGRLALKQHYQLIETEVSGPLYKGYEVDDQQIRLFFTHSKGLFAKGGSLTHFEIAGPDKIFHPAIARIEGETIIVSAATEKRPVAVRFAWKNTAEPNLFNAAQLPASCFRTDDWE